jgi:hypothetical protein
MPGFAAPGGSGQGAARNDFASLAPARRSAWSNEKQDMHGRYNI